MRAPALNPSHNIHFLFQIDNMYTRYSSQQQQGDVRRRLVPWITTVAVVTSIVLTTLSFVDVRSNLGPSQQLLEPRNGNTSVASDIYGLGVRVGVYTQVIGMLLSITSREVAGLKSGVSAFIIGLMASWTVLAAHKSISPSESGVILCLVNILLIVDTLLFSRKGLDGQDILGIVGSLWVLVSNLWLWSTLVLQLPLLGTENQTWFFTRVSLVGGYRIFLLVLFGIGAFCLLIGLVVLGVIYFTIRPKIQITVDESAANHLNQQIEKAITRESILRAIGSTIAMIFVIATVEMTIEYNGLQPETDLSLPGQTIPFAIGLVTLFQGCVIAVTKVWKSLRGDDSKEGSGSGNGDGIGYEIRIGGPVTATSAVPRTVASGNGDAETNDNGNN